MQKNKAVTTDMTKRISKMTGLYQYQVRKVMTAAIQCIVNDLALGKTVSLLSLGKFRLQKREKRKAFNPYTKEWFELEDCHVPKFKFGKRAYDFIKCEATKNIEGSD